MKFPADGYTRVAILPAVANLAAPTLDEIGDGVDITCDLTADGLRLPRSTATQDATPWRGPLEIERPTRVNMAGSSLQGYRFRLEAEVLWDAAVFKARGFLVVRRSMPFDTGWAATQVVEALDFRFGKRTTADTASDAMVTFTVPIFVTAEEDEAVIAA